MKKSMKILCLALSILMVMSIILTGCAQKTEKAPDAAKTDSTKSQNANNEPVKNKVSGKVLFWHTYSDTEEKIFNEEAVTAFNNEYPDVNVEVVRMPYDGLKQQLITAIAGEAAPDIMRMDIIWVPEFAKMGALEELDGKEGFKEIKSNVFEGPLNTNYFNGKFYGLPLNTNTKVAIYNKDILKELNAAEPPKTFDELIELSKKLKEKGGDKWGIGLGGTHTWGMIPYFCSLGGRLTDDKYTVATGYVNSEASVKALEKIVQLHDEGLIGPCILGEEPNTWGGMEAGNYLMIDDGPWYFSMQQDKGIKEKVIAVPMPAGPGGSCSVIGGEDVVMFKGSKNKEATWEFMKFMLSEKVQSVMGKTGLIPGLKQAANADMFKNDPISQVYVKQLETALPRTPHPKWEQISEQFGLAFEKAVRKQGIPKQLLDELAAKMDEALKNN